MAQSLYRIAWLFLIYAFLGWCSEVVFAASNSGKFVNRGFLSGPVCPIYGFGVLSVVLCLEPIQENVLLLFLGSVVLTSTLEYLTGFILEKLFHDKWWDYSGQPFNLHGYICLKFSLLWGFACVLIIRVVHPMIETLLRLVDNLAGRIALGVLAAVFLVDVVLTVLEASRLPRRLRAIQEMEDALRHISEEIGENLTEKTVEAKEKNEELQAGLAQARVKAEQRRAELAEKGEALREDLRGRGETLHTELEEISRKRQEMQQSRRKEREELFARYEGLLEKRSAVQERLLIVFPRLSEGRYRGPAESLRRAAQKRKEERKNKQKR